jgi:hypothetical protein
MKLPKLDVPIYETKLVSNDKVVKFRPFLIKEQKLFLMASQSDDPVEIVNSIKQVLRNCIVSDDVNIDELSSFDLEYLFLNLRAKSVGEVVDLSYTCNNTVKDDKGEEKKCGGLVKFQVNLLDIKPTIEKEHSLKIELKKDLGLVMKYPTFSSIASIENAENAGPVELILACVDYIYDNENIYYAKDFSKEELTEFFDSMQQSDFAKVENFFKTMPRITKTLNFKCGKCGHQEDITLEGVQSFFG